jgi:hypothetical protein
MARSGNLRHARFFVHTVCRLRPIDRKGDDFGQ